MKTVVAVVDNGFGLKLYKNNQTIFWGDILYIQRIKRGLFVNMIQCFPSGPTSLILLTVVQCRNLACKKLFIV